MGILQALKIVGTSLVAAILALTLVALCLTGGAFFAVLSGSSSFRVGIQFTAVIYLFIVVAMMMIWLRDREDVRRVAFLLLGTPVILYATTYYGLWYFELWFWIVAWATIFMVMLLHPPEPDIMNRS